MANLAYDPNKEETPDTSTNILNPQAPTLTAAGETQTQDVSSSGGSGYVSNGNPYGKYGTPQSTAQAQPTASQSVKKSNSSAPSSGTHTNVQSYIQKNQQGSQNLGQAVAGKVQSTADIAKQNLTGTQQSFRQGVDAGSLENWQGAVDEAKGAFNEAATQKAPERQYHENAATMYNPQAREDGTYSAEDQALIKSNQARVVFGDGTTRDYTTQAEAQAAINDWNRLNPGYYTYSEQPQLSVGDQRLADILNAKYQGPTDLYQAQGYGDTYNQFQKAQNLQDLAQSTGFKGTLLKETFENPSTTYSLGNQLLDDLLLGQGQAAETLRNTAQNLGSSPSGRIGDDLTQAVKDARQEALLRSGEIDDVRKGARSALDEVALGRENEIENRLSSVIADWDKYPQYFKDVLTQELQRHEGAKKQVDTYKNLSSNISSLQKQVNNLTKLTAKAPTSLATEYQNLLQKQNFATLSNRNPQLTAQEQARLQELSVLARQNGRGVNALKILDQLYQQEYKNNLATLSKLQQTLTKQQSQLDSIRNQYGDLTKFNPDNMNLNLSQLEAEMLGIKGGEGLYNILKNGGIDNLIKTAQSNREQLISQDEQSQLARLQSIAELANDYGSVDSGINFRNDYVNRDLAGTQSALDALDLNNFRDVMQAAEKNFQNKAKSTTLTGTGTKKSTSGGALGKKSSKKTVNLSQNLGKLISSADGWRNMYSDEGVNQDNINKILGLSDSLAQFENSYDDRSGTTGAFSPSELAQAYTGTSNDDTLGQIIGAGTSYGNTLDIGNFLGAVGGVTKDIGNLLGADLLSKSGVGLDKLGSAVSSSLFGNSNVSAKAMEGATEYALADLTSKINKELKEQGYGNQLNVTQNNERDLELLRLLGLMDKTNRVY